MSKAEKFIQNCTRNCSNIMEGYYPNGKQVYFPWLTPDQARKAVEIAREEMIMDAKQSEVMITSGGILLPNLRIEDFDYADKVKLIILKED